MPDAPLPKFRYHPDPVSSGSIVPTDAECKVCRQMRGWLYEGPVFSEIDLTDAICPWCIADGSAHREFGAEFVDPPAVGDYGRLDPTPTDVIEEIACRTPSFNGWQQERWLTHCGDASLFIAPMGAKELAEVGPEAYMVVAQETGFSDEDLSQYMQSLDRDFGPTAYVFRCRHCGAWSGYSDCP